MPEIVQEIGAYAGLAAVAGLAVLSVLYFSQARDVKRLREWAGRAPERAAEPGGPVTPVPGRVQAQPQPQPKPQPAGSPPVPGVPVPGAKPGVPVPGAKPAPAAPAPGVQPAPGQPQPSGAPAKPGPPRPAGAPAIAAAAGAGPASATQAKPADAKPSEADGADPKPADADLKPSEADGAGAAASAQAPAKPAAPASPADADGDPAPVPSTGPGGPATPAGGRPQGAPPVPPAARPPGDAPGRLPPSVPGQRSQAGERAPVRRVLPPRPMPDQTAIIPPRRDPWYRRLVANPRYLVLLLAGILIIGGAAAAGITQLAGDDDPSRPAGQSGSNGAAGGEVEDGDGQGSEPRQGVVPANVSVAVLNGTTVPGLAQQIADQIQAEGFNVGTVANSADQEQQRAESVVLYSQGYEREARAVNRRLGINQRQPIDPASQELAGDATVVVIAGADRAQ